jgi:hypothetical protein
MILSAQLGVEDRKQRPQQFAAIFAVGAASGGGGDPGAGTLVGALGGQLRSGSSGREPSMCCILNAYSTSECPAPPGAAGSTD